MDRGGRALLSLVGRGSRSKAWAIGSPLLAVALTIVATGLSFLLFGKPPLHALDVFLVEPLRSPTGLSELGVKAAPLVLIGVGLALACRAGIWNIGAEGQYTLGAICGGGVGLHFPDAPAALLFPGMALAALAGGAAYAGIVAVLRTRFNASEILTSLMLNYVAQLVLIYLVSVAWRDPEGFGFPQTATFSANASAPILVEGTRLHVGIAVALVVSLCGALVLTRTTFGFALRVQGLAPRAARFAGFSETRLIAVALLVSGGLAGLAGLFEVAGPIGQLTPQISPGYGYTAIIVAFLGRLDPLGVLLAGLLLALSYLGGEAAQMDLALPSAVTGIFQGILLFFLLACDAMILFRLRVSTRPRPATDAVAAEPVRAS